MPMAAFGRQLPLLASVLAARRQQHAPGFTVEFAAGGGADGLVVAFVEQVVKVQCGRAVLVDGFRRSEAKRHTPGRREVAIASS